MASLNREEWGFCTTHGRGKGRKVRRQRSSTRQKKKGGKGKEKKKKGQFIVVEEWAGFCPPMRYMKLRNAARRHDNGEKR